MMFATLVFALICSGLQELVRVVLGGVQGDRDSEERGPGGRSWRVRLKLAQKFAILCQKLQPEQTSQFILTSFGNLLRDTEQEVRAAVVLNLF